MVLKRRGGSPSERKYQDQGGESANGAFFPLLIEDWKPHAHARAPKPVWDQSKKTPWPLSPEDNPNSQPNPPSEAKYARQIASGWAARDAAVRPLPRPLPPRLLLRAAPRPRVVVLVRRRRRHGGIGGRESAPPRRRLHTTTSRRYRRLHTTAPRMPRSNERQTRAAPRRRVRPTSRPSSFSRLHRRRG